MSRWCFISRRYRTGEHKPPLELEDECWIADDQRTYSGNRHQSNAFNLFPSLLGSR